MAHIHVLEYDETSGVARREYDAATRRAGRIWNIVSIQSQLPEVMRDEMIAVVTSRSNECHY
jgi:hypothetical protein